MTGRACSREPHRFRIVVEGYTRFVAANEKAADVTLIMPRHFRKYDDTLSNEIMLGSLPLAGVEWIAEPLKVGDIVTDAAQLDELPDGSVVCRPMDAGIPFRKLHGHWQAGYAGDRATPVKLAAHGDMTVLRIGGRS